MMHIGFLGSRHGSSVVLLGRPGGAALSRYQSGKPVLGLTGPALARPSDGSGSWLMMAPPGPASATPARPTTKSSVRNAMFRRGRPPRRRRMREVRDKPEEARV